MRTFLGSFRYRKSANFLDVPIRKTQICKLSWFIRKFFKILHNSVFKTVLTVVFWRRFFILYNFELKHYMLFLRLAKVFCPKVCKSKKIISVRKFADLQFAELICGPPTFAYQVVPATQSNNIKSKNWHVKIHIQCIQYVKNHWELLWVFFGASPYIVLAFFV
jgi:hypothetical protein